MTMILIMIIMIKIIIIIIIIYKSKKMLYVVVRLFTGLLKTEKIFRKQSSAFGLK